MRELQFLVEKFLHYHKSDIEKEWGIAENHYEDNMWLYTLKGFLFGHNEIVFIFEDNIVVDISKTDYIFGKGYRNIFYNEHSDPEYEVQNILLKCLFPVDSKKKESLIGLTKKEVLLRFGCECLTDYNEKWIYVFKNLWWGSSKFLYLEFDENNRVRQYYFSYK